MEIDVTALVTGGGHREFSGSRAERGWNAGPETWANAQGEAAERPILKTADELDAARDHIEGMGFGEKVQKYKPRDVNALFTQLVSGDVREAQALTPGDGPGGIDWTDHQVLAVAGTIPSNLFVSGDKVYFYLGS